METTQEARAMGDGVADGLPVGVLLILAAATVVEDAKVALVEARAALKAVKDSAATGGDAMTMRVAHDLYWSHEHVPVAVLVAATGCANVREFLLTVPPVPSGYVCTGCGASLVYRSRAGLKTDDRGVHACECRKVRDAARSAAYREAEIGRRTRLTELRAMNYRDYLLTPEWNETRAAAVRRAKGRCQVCNARARLDVHHRTYERLGMEWSTDLLALCRSCHGTFHKNGKLA